MNKLNYTVGQKVTYKLENKGVIVFEYLGRGLNAFLKLKDGDEFVVIKESGHVEPFGEYEFSDPINTNEYRRMIGRYLYSYDIIVDKEADKEEQEEAFRYVVHPYTPELLGSYIHEWISNVKIPQDDFIKLFNPDADTVSELMDKYIEEYYEDEDDR